MNSSKIIPKLIVLTTVGILICSFIPIVIASEGKGRITTRPIEDWLIPNNSDIDLAVGGWLDFETWLVIWPHLVDPAAFLNPPTPSCMPILSCSYTGFILQRELNDNKLSITINLHVEDVPFYVCLNPLTPIFNGDMDYTYHFKFLIDLNLYPEFLFDEFGNVMFAPWYMYVYFPDMMGTELVSIHLNGEGEGSFLESWNSWEAGDIGKMKVNNILLIKDDFKQDHPNYNLYGLNELLPVAFIFLH
ncbi:MAG: hypothetical protein ACFFFB_25380 [Candidatus Heimdallarchaeota archaeon]